MVSMNKMSVLITGFIVLLVGVVLLSSLADNESSIRTLLTVTDDQFTMDNTTCVQITSGCISSLTSVENATGAEVIGAGNYSLCRSSGNQDGILVSADTSIDRYNGLTINATYTHSPGCTYVSSGISRTFIGLIPIFFALFVLLIGVGIFMKSKEGAF